MPKTAAERMRTLRRRQARGAIVVRIEVSHETLGAMLDAGLLSEAAALNGEAVAAAAARVLREAVRQERRVIR